ncbi:FAD-dependent monooxygenase [Lysinibacillus yapensis]|uniref:FAD-dependent monooxygenase n=1 Tax=Ureibacillus yapensis TaxID=2304605 RepID=A0A396SDI8_9BACL|nr:NAD(P)/FAD-dependent oxidoreductase [Lysinibacillus yapensis]RHW39384.1 FAD-dependent monooxygenase [Lysinibacillus yapensis]
MAAKSLRVAIIGSGIAGASAAVALKAKGIRADVYEQAPVLGEVGAGIGIRQPSIRAIKKWGIFEEFDKVTCESPRMQIIAGEDNVIIEENWPILTDPTERFPRLIHRADLLDSLTAQIPADQLHLDHRLVDVEEKDETVEVTFANGKKIEVDVLIAADGIRSPVRDKVLGKKEPVFSGYVAHRALVPFDDALGMACEDNTLRIYVDGDNSYYLLPLLNGRRQVSVDITIPGENELRPVYTKEQLLEGIKGFGPTLQKIIENIDMNKIVSRPLSDLEPFDVWSTKTITVIGDAAHAMLHNQGQGANMAIQDADVLADVLGEVAEGKSTVAEALKSYEEQRKPITKLYQNLSRLFPTEQAKTAFPEKEHLEVGK